MYLSGKLVGECYECGNSMEYPVKKFKGSTQYILTCDKCGSTNVVYLECSQRLIRE